MELARKTQVRIFQCLFVSKLNSWRKSNPCAHRCLPLNHHQHFGIYGGLNIALWIHLCQSSCCPGFESQAHHLCFYHFKSFLCFTCHVKRTKINKKRPGLVHYFFGFYLEGDRLLESPFTRYWLLLLVVGSVT